MPISYQITKEEITFLIISLSENKYLIESVERKQFICKSKTKDKAYSL